MTQVFCRNKFPSWKQSYRYRRKGPKYMFTERFAISLAYSSFGFKLGVFPTYNSNKFYRKSPRSKCLQNDLPFHWLILVLALN